MSPNAVFIDGSPHSIMQIYDKFKSIGYVDFVYEIISQLSPTIKEAVNIIDKSKKYLFTGGDFVDFFNHLDMLCDKILASDDLYPHYDLEFDLIADYHVIPDEIKIMSGKKIMINSLTQFQKNFFIIFALETFII